MKLTKPQEMIWDMERFGGGSVAVICTSMLRRGSVEESTLRHVVDMLFLNNDALRTQIKLTDCGVTQKVGQYRQGHAQVLRFTDTTQLQEYADRYAKTPMNLSEMLCEISILLLPDQYGLLIKIHHLIADAWTMALLATQFHMLVDGEQTNFGSYQTYLERETAYINSKRYSADKRFFLDMIKKVDTPVYIREQQADNLAAERECFVIPKEITTRIHLFTEKFNCSVFSVFATVLACYISRINRNAEKIFIGTTVLNRMNNLEMQTAGMFVNTVPVLLTISENCSFLETLEKSEDMLVSLFRHQRYNYTQLLREAGEEISFDGRLFDVMLNYMDAKVTDTQEQTQCIWHHNGMQTESLQIHLDDRNHEGIFRVTYDYRKEMFSPEDIRNLQSHLMNMLLDGIEHPWKKCHMLHMLSPEEEYQLRVVFNNTAKEYPISQDATVSGLFEETAAKNPEKTCMYIDGKCVSYGELLRWSWVVDAEIRKRTNNKKSVVAVIADRSVEMYCAIYGIIRGGNAYLPILPDTPKERISYFLRNSGAALVLSQTEYTNLAGDVECIDLSQLIQKQSYLETIPDRAAEPEDTAYVMYTSGSTGMPKGVKISHKAIINRILWMNDAYPLGEDSVILQKTVYTFDVSVWEVFWWGMCGGAMAVSRPNEHAMPGKILEEVFQNKVTHLHFVPSVFDVFLSYLEHKEGEREKFASVRHVFLSGEKLDHSLVSRFYSLYSHSKVKLHNLYGPTECAVDVTYYDCLPTDTVIPIGKPIYNTQIYIADRYLNLLPVGVKGELLIGGYNVGQGYINAQKLTQDRYVNNPFGDGRLYKTGDLAYLRDDGQIIFCGRIDSQIKINGQRIEPGEIETVVKDVPNVEAAAVIVREEKGRKQLVAYYCSREPVENTVLEACRKKLPHYMIPCLVRIDSLPLLPNGKVDRNALQKMNVEFSGMESADPPENALEKHICDMYCRVLKKDRVGRNSNFFALGGDSLAAITFLAECGYEQISVAQFIGNPTPARLAALIQDGQKRNVGHVQVIYKPEKTRKAYILFPFAGGDAGMYANLTQKINQLDNEVALYFVPFLHTFCACDEAAEEIVKLTKECDVSFYSHCAGSAVALRVLQYIEEKYGVLIKHYYAAGSVPFRTFGAFNGWNCVRDSFLIKLLKNAGAPDSLLQGSHAADMLKRFRADTDFAAKYFSESPKNISCPVTVLLGRKDLFTRFFQRVEKHWRNYAKYITAVRYIETSNHYFHSEESKTVAEILLEK